jgi:hypothetical protein
MEGGAMKANASFIADTREKDAWENDPAALAAAACVRGVIASIDVPDLGDPAYDASVDAALAVLAEIGRRPARKPWWKRWGRG